MEKSYTSLNPLFIRGKIQFACSLVDISIVTYMSQSLIHQGENSIKSGRVNEISPNFKTSQSLIHQGENSIKMINVSETSDITMSQSLIPQGETSILLIIFSS